MTYEQDPSAKDTSGLTRREVLRATLGLLVFASGCSAPDDPAVNRPTPEATATATPTPERETAHKFIDEAARALVALGEDTGNGWRFPSAIQMPHYQTDRDVGASGVGMGFLAMTSIDPDTPLWLEAAEQTGAWLMSVAEKSDNGTVFWPDYVDDGETSPDIYTSFDDGSVGIGDFFWRLYEQTGNEQYRDVSTAALRWTFSQAENIGSSNHPVYRWTWSMGDDEPTYFMGMGQGIAGLVHTFATYYERTKDSDPALAQTCKRYIDGSLRYIRQVRSELGRNDGDSRALPETGEIGMDGDTCMNAGYLSGAAGAAFMYLKLHDVFDDDSYLTEARKLFSWLENTDTGPMVQFKDGSVAWKLAIDPQGGDVPALATGFEEGSAGIGWTYLQAYRLTGEKRYLDVAKRAGNWLIKVAVREDNGVTWREHESPAKQITHANLNNGAAGIGLFLLDLAELSGKEKYRDCAEAAQQWLINSARRDDETTPLYWDDNDGENYYSRDPSWHWGTAGIVAFLARMAGGKQDIPGQQESIRRR